MIENLPEKNRQDIERLTQTTNKLTTDFAVTSVKIDNITQSVLEIKNNHLLHINDQLGILNQTVASNQTLTTKLITDKVNEIYSKIGDLKISDAKQEPSNSLFNKIIEYVILGVIGIGIAYISSR